MTKGSMTQAPIISWSFSRLSTWWKCKRKAFYLYVQKLKEPPSSHMQDGNYVDHVAEVWASGNLDKPLPREVAEYADKYAVALKKMRKGEVPTELWNFTASFAALRERASSLHLQEQMCFDKNWKLIHDPRAWFDTSGRTWHRAKMDCWYDEGHRRIVIDFKNGKRVRDEHLQQLDLYALIAFLIAPPTITEVVVELWYLQIPEKQPTPPRVYTRSEVPALLKKWTKAATAFLKDKRFEEMPGRECSWCAFNKSVGGPCNAGDTEGANA